MRLIEKTSLDAYAQQFWQRQERKRDPNDGLAISGINKGESRVSWLANIYPYKLPKPYNATIELVEFQAADELDRLLIHDYMVRDNWMVERCLEFPTKSGHEVKGYTDCSYSAGETYPSEE